LKNCKTAIVVGASSGIGRECAKQLAAAGVKVAAVARRAERLDQLKGEFPDKIIPFPHDVTNTDEIPDLFMRITQELGGLDLIIYASGVMSDVGRHEFNTAKDLPMIEVNVTGAIAWLNEAAHRFERVGHGSIVCIGSVAGDRGRVGQPVYNASKSFVATYMEALRNRLHRLGVRVTTIKPGPTETEMTSHLHMKKMPVEVAARKTLQLVGRSGEFYLSPMHKIAFFVIRNFPSLLFRRLSV
jgi:NADP-dependent 3-hydroxy acid dehydrogenase YdfG